MDSSIMVANGSDDDKNVLLEVNGRRMDDHTNAVNPKRISNDCYLTKSWKGIYGWSHKCCQLLGNTNGGKGKDQWSPHQRCEL